jgi:peptidoglycan-N-acetylglucosamine deacetylase
MTGRLRALAASGVLVVTVTAVLMSGATAAATSSASAPLHIQSSSLGQDGQELVWRVQLASPFAPSQLSRDGRSLCLLIERPATGTVAGQVCVAGPSGRSRSPRLLYTPVGPGRPRAVPATVTRGSDSQLTARFLPADAGTAYRPLRWQVMSTLRAAACAPPPPSGGTCFELDPSRPTLLKLHTPVLVGCTPAGPSLVSHGPAHLREVALTFDDGPWGTPPTSAFLHVLERAHVPGTFFEIGDQIGSYDPGGRLERRMLADGDLIGDHTWSHPSMPGLSRGAQAGQLSSTASAIRRATGGFRPCLWRPPYGALNGSLVSLARSLGFLTITWDVDPRDWATPGVGAIYGNVVGNARDGSIVLQHFGGGPRYQTLAALPQEIATLRRRGFKFVTVSQLLGLRLIYR